MNVYGADNDPEQDIKGPESGPTDLSKAPSARIFGLCTTVTYWVPIEYENYAYPTMVLAKMTLAGRTDKRSQVAKNVAPMHHKFESSKILDADINFCNCRKQQQHKQW
jgi:hypothetical protein